MSDDSRKRKYSEFSQNIEIPPREDNKHIVKIEFTRRRGPAKYCILYENSKRYFCFQRKANLAAIINAVDPQVTGGSYRWKKDNNDDWIWMDGRKKERHCSCTESIFLCLSRYNR